MAIRRNFAKRLPDTAASLSRVFVSKVTAVFFLGSYLGRIQLPAINRNPA